MAMAVGGRGKEDAAAVKLDTYIGLQSSLHHMVGHEPRKKERWGFLTTLLNCSGFHPCMGLEMFLGSLPVPFRACRFTLGRRQRTGWVGRDWMQLHVGFRFQRFRALCPDLRFRAY